MADKKHHYQIKNVWKGNTGKGTQSYTSYLRDHQIQVNEKSELYLSADPSFRGNPARHNPEELLVASLSSCHMLWYLHLCAVNSINVLSYEDQASGTMVETADGGGRFEEVVLQPHITIEGSEMKEKAVALHHEANKKCFIANSCNFPVRHDPVIITT